MQLIATQPRVAGEEEASSSQESTDILGVQISALSMRGAVGQIEKWISERTRHYVCICTVHTIMECHDLPAYKAIVNGAGMRTPDGMPLVWLSHRAGHPGVTRVYGPDLMLEMCARSITRGYKHFLYGGGPGVADQLADNLTSRFPGLQIVGTHTPPHLAVGEIECEDTIEMINASGADIVWVGLGTPKQDWWVANHRRLLNAPVLIAVGAAFDFHSGRVRQAPRWMQRNGLEWFFRLTQDPKRLWRRYLILNSRFLMSLLLHRIPHMRD